jgi:hypothetical protein
MLFLFSLCQCEYAKFLKEKLGFAIWWRFAVSRSASKELQDVGQSWRN